MKHHPLGENELLPGYDPLNITPRDYKYYITQNFGENPKYYARWNKPGHGGLDMGTHGKYIVVYACDNGKIISNFWQHGSTGTYGKHVRLLLDSGETLIYAHLSRVDIKPGQKILRGQVLGNVGTTGNSTGVHLHFAVRDPGAHERGETEFKNDEIDPIPWLADYIVDNADLAPPDVDMPEFDTEGLGDMFRQMRNREKEYYAEQVKALNRMHDERMKKYDEAIKEVEK